MLRACWFMYYLESLRSLTPLNSYIRESVIKITFCAGHVRNRRPFRKRWEKSRCVLQLSKTPRFCEKTAQLHLLFHQLSDGGQQGYRDFRTCPGSDRGQLRRYTDFSDMFAKMRCFFTPSLSNLRFPKTTTLGPTSTLSTHIKRSCHIILKVTNREGNFRDHKLRVPDVFV